MERLELKLIDLLKDQLQYKEGELVYHKTGDQGPGVIVSWRLFGVENIIQYLVSFNPGEQYWMDSQEITSDKPVM